MSRILLFEKGECLEYTVYIEDNYNCCKCRINKKEIRNNTIFYIIFSRKLRYFDEYCRNIAKIINFFNIFVLQIDIYYIFALD